MAESLSKITAVLEQAKEMTIEAANSARTSGTLGENGVFRPRDVKRFLNSRHEKEKLAGMKAIANMMSRSEDVTEYFPEIVKNSAAQTLEVRKLVYIYLLRYAERESDLALLSINAIQKSLGDQNPQIRAMAIKVLSGIKVPSIAPIILLAIRKSIVDMSAVVRRASAVAIGNAYELDKSNLEVLVGYLATLLGDKSFYVLGSAVKTFLNICPDRLDMLHVNYRRYCGVLADIEEWGQVCVLDVLTRYVRVYVPKGKTEQKIKKKNTSTFYSDDEASDKEEAETESEFIIDPDLELLLAAAKPLLQSRNSAVAMAVVNLFYSLVPEADLSFLGPPLVRLLALPQELRYIVMTNIVVLAMQSHGLFAPYLKYFYVLPSDIPKIAKLKIEVLTLSCSEANLSDVLSELQYYATSADNFLVAEAVRAIGRVAQISSTAARRCLRWLLKQIHSPNHILVGESLTVIRYIIQLSPRDNIKTVARLANALESAKVPLARASIVWLVGEFAGLAQNIAPDVLRKCAKTFTSEDECTRSQIVLLASKVYSYYIEDRPAHNEVVGEDGLVEKELEPTVKPSADPMDLLFDYIMLMARYDTSYDLRDRARLYKAVLSAPGAPLAKLLLQAPKPSPYAPSPSAGKEQFMIGSTRMLVRGVIIGGERPLPLWSTETPDSSIRDPVSHDVEEDSKSVLVKKIMSSTTKKNRKSQKKSKVKNLPIAQKAVSKKLAKKSAPESYHTSLDEFFGEAATGDTSAPEIDESTAAEEEESSGSEVEVVVEVSESDESAEADTDEEEEEESAEESGSEEASDDDEQVAEITSDESDDEGASQTLLHGR
ncbi:adaptin N terminal region-domain-containing protein [Limtongia smithiae]|uniref:adaptin N terminal region-domain-containing protein n=1 Tax=Limtongia smithiae TaxID=1125753 RepID=UPI0034CF1DEB